MSEEIARIEIENAKRKVEEAKQKLRNIEADKWTIKFFKALDKHYEITKTLKDHESICLDCGTKNTWLETGSAEHGGVLTYDINGQIIPEYSEFPSIDCISIWCRSCGERLMRAGKLSAEDITEKGPPEKAGFVFISEILVERIAEEIDYAEERKLKIDLKKYIDLVLSIVSDWEVHSKYFLIPWVMEHNGHFKRIIPYNDE